LHARPSGFHATREPLQIGAEIYGHAGLEADGEIQALALASLRLAGLSEVTLDLSHAGILQGILDGDATAMKRKSDIVTLLRAKDVPALQALSASFSEPVRSALCLLPSLYGDLSVLDRARAGLPASATLNRALDELALLVQSAQAAQASSHLQVNIDLADLSGYQYESGAMFALYVPGLPNAVARGGRYDHLGEAFGRARPATGFSMDLREIARLLPSAAPAGAIRAPWGREPELTSLIAHLRDEGEIVIQSLPGHENDQQEFDCNREIVIEQGKFVIKKNQNSQGS
jgi:ATP phosphoribosyltransferase regulatory subunit